MIDRPPQMLLVKVSRVRYWRQITAISSGLKFSGVKEASAHFCGLAIPYKFNSVQDKSATSSQPSPLLLLMLVLSREMDNCLCITSQPVLFSSSVGWRQILWYTRNWLPQANAAFIFKPIHNNRIGLRQCYPLFVRKQGGQ